MLEKVEFNEKIQDALVQVLNDDQLLKKFMNIDDIEEIYKFCLEVKGGYTFSEFINYLSELSDECNVLSDNLLENNDGSLSDSEIEQVSGGIGMIGKFTSGGLAALSMFTATGLGNKASATDLSSGANTTKYVRMDFGDNNTKPDEKLTDEQKKTLGQKIKNGFKNAGKWMWNHKKQLAIGGAIAAGITAGAAATIGGGVYVIHKVKENKKDSPNIKETREDLQAKIKIYNDAINAKKKEYDSNKDIGNDKERAEKLRIYEDSTREYQNRINDLNNQLNNLNQIKNIGHKLQNNTGTIGAIATIVAGGVSVLSATGSAIGNFVRSSSKFTRNLKTLLDAPKDVAATVKRIQQARDALESKVSSQDFDKEERRAALVNNLKLVKGQDAAKEKILQIFDNIVAEREMAAKNPKFAANLRPKLVYLAGGAGTGKTMCAKFLADALAIGKPPHEMTASTDIKVGSNPGDTLENMFKFNESGFSWGFDEKTKENLGKYVKENASGVAIINEVDKTNASSSSSRSKYNDMFSQNISDSKKSPLDEVFRKLYEDRKVKNGEYGDDIPLNNFVFIMTTNEKDQCLKPDAPYIAERDDGSRTEVTHDGSFLTRTRVILFDALTEEAHTEIAKNKIEFLLKYFHDNNNHNFNISKDFYKKIGKYSLNEKNGARTLERLFDDLMGKLTYATVTQKQIAAEAKMKKEHKDDISDIKIDDPKDFEFNLDFENGEFKIDIVSYGNYNDYIKPVERVR